MGEPRLEPDPPLIEVGPAELDDDGLDPLRPGTAPPARRRRQGVLFWLAVGWLGVVVFCALFADVLPVPDPNGQNISDRLATPSADYPLGTDGLGRDSMARLVHGARVSLTVSLTAVVVGMSVGGTLGMVAGFTRGLFDTVLMSVINIILAFPGLVLLLVLLAYVGQSLSVISLVIGFLSIPVYTRVARANTLAVAQREFVLAAHTMGATKLRLLFREIAPNVVLPVMAFGLVAMGVIIVLEGTLAFLGLSVEAPAATWGGMIAEGKRHLHSSPHVALIPSAAMFLTVLSLNFAGDILRRRFDVREANL
ncbi:MAG TPA: ABC transporter permease [Acidimicrobiales bacterium]|nr:ABC transporter permease [Acidimicrobiales bacterium]